VAQNWGCSKKLPKNKLNFIGIVIFRAAFIKKKTEKKKTNEGLQFGLKFYREIFHLSTGHF